MSEHILTKRENSALCIQLHRPEKKNALTAEMYACLCESLKAADAAPDVRVIILHGVEGCFTSGNDLETMRNKPSDDRGYPHNQFIDALSQVQKPVIAAVSGISLGVGTFMLFHCDFVFATEKSRFSLPFINLGISPEGGTSYYLPRLVGHQKAAELILLGERFDSELAEQIGLVNEVVPEEELLGKALETADKLAQKSPEAIRAAKGLLKRGMKTSLNAAIDNEKEVFTERMESDEVTEAIARFFTK